jgi:hypothetical protein
MFMSIIRFCLILSLQFPLSKFLNLKIQMEHSHLIVEPNVTQKKIKKKLIGHFMTIIFLNYWRFVQI